MQHMIPNQPPCHNAQVVPMNMQITLHQKSAPMLAFRDLFVSAPNLATSPLTTTVC